jgi:hypothetical protein
VLKSAAISNTNASGSILYFTSNENVPILIKGGSYDALESANSGSLFCLIHSGTTYHSATISLSPKFMSVSASGSYGGLFYLYNVHYTDILGGSTYYNSTSTLGGGAFYSYASTIAIKDSSFDSIGSPNGGVFDLDSSMITMSDTTISNINCSTSGGVFYQTSSESIITNLTFTNVKISINGGILYLKTNSNTTVSASIINNVYSIAFAQNLVGGVIYLN